MYIGGQKKLSQLWNYYSNHISLTGHQEGLLSKIIARPKLIVKDQCWNEQLSLSLLLLTEIMIDKCTISCDFFCLQPLPEFKLHLVNSLSASCWSKMVMICPTLKKFAIKYCLCCDTHSIIVCLKNMTLLSMWKI